MLMGMHPYEQTKNMIADLWDGGLDCGVDCLVFASPRSAEVKACDLSPISM